MTLNDQPNVARQAPRADHERMAQEESAVEGATSTPDRGAAGPQFNPWRQDIIKVLNDSLATELVCVLRYKGHHFIADGLAMPKIAEEFLGYANEELLHADQLARRIVQLGGEPDFSPFSLIQHYAAYDDSVDLKVMIRADLIAENAVIDNYCRILTLIGDSDLTTRHLVEGILIDEMEHAEELRGLITD